MKMKMHLIQFVSIVNCIQMKSSEVSDNPWRNSIWELQSNQESRHGWFRERKGWEAATTFRLNHFAHKFDADKIDSLWIGILFVSIEQRERIASKDKFYNDQILNVYIIWNWIHQKMEITRNSTGPSIALEICPSSRICVCFTVFRTWLAGEDVCYRPWWSEMCQPISVDYRDQKVNEIISGAVNLSSDVNKSNSDSFWEMGFTSWFESAV
jgi:hypothetical protein